MNTPTEFVYWLQGFVELQDSDSVSDKQWQIIKDHLKLVFDKKTPDRIEVKPNVTIGGGNAIQGMVSKELIDSIRYPYGQAIC